MKGPTIRALVVDDFQPWHDFIFKMLQDQPELQVIANAYDGAEGVQQAQELQPDLILLDIGLPSLNGIKAALRIRKVAPKSKILFATENRSEEIVEAALSTGANGYLVKSSGGKELLPAIDAVLQGKQFVSECVKDQSLNNHADPAQRETAVAPSLFQSIDCHDLRLYADDAAFADEFAQSIEAAVGNGTASIVIATESHRSRLRQKLRADGVAVDTVIEHSLLTFLDVADALSTFMVEAATDENRSVGIPKVILEAVRTAKERHLHVELG